jgi:hypothetical protein
VGPLAAALPRAPTPRHRGVILAALLTFSREAEVPVSEALIKLIDREKDPTVRMAAQMGLQRLIAADLLDTAARRSRAGQPAGKSFTPEPPPPQR